MKIKNHCFSIKYTLDNQSVENVQIFETYNYYNIPCDYGRKKQKPLKYTCSAFFLSCKIISVGSLTLSCGNAASVSWLLCDVSFIDNTEKLCSHRYVLPNIQSIWAVCGWSWDTDFSFSCSTIWMFIGAFSICTANEWLSSNLGSGLQSRQVTVWTWYEPCPVFQQNVHLKTQWQKTGVSWNIEWQHSKWPKIPCNICISQKCSLVLKALTEACMSVITRSHSWSWRFNALRWFFMSQRNASSVFSLCFPQTDSFLHATLYLLSTFTYFSQHTSAW